MFYFIFKKREEYNIIREVIYTATVDLEWVLGPFLAEGKSLHGGIQF